MVTVSLRRRDSSVAEGSQQNEPEDVTDPFIAGRLHTAFKLLSALLICGAAFAGWRLRFYGGPWIWNENTLTQNRQPFMVNERLMALKERLSILNEERLVLPTEMAKLNQQMWTLEEKMSMLDENLSMLNEKILKLDERMLKQELPNDPVTSYPPIAGPESDCIIWVRDWMEADHVKLLVPCTSDWAKIKPLLKNAVAPAMNNIPVTDSWLLHPTQGRLRMIDTIKQSIPVDFKHPILVFLNSAGKHKKRATRNI